LPAVHFGVPFNDKKSEADEIREKRQTRRTGCQSVPAELPQTIYGFISVTIWIVSSFIFSCADGKQLAIGHDCKFIETSSGIQHNVDELLVGILKQIRLREDLDKKRRKKKLMGGGSRTSLSLSVARDILQKMCLQDNKSKSCENLLVL
jgi:hypothetical protein